MLPARPYPHHDETPLQLPGGFEKGQVFTPSFLASWVALLLEEQLGHDWDGCLLDPACGDGALLAAASEHLPNSQLLGVDIDPDASSTAKARLGGNATIANSDSLLAASLCSSSSASTVGAIISNPPWGADLLHSPAQLRSRGYSLANGQFDSWSLFVEMSLALLQPDGVAVFILPDAIFSPEHTQTRRLISANHSIELIARLGEGIFRDIYRGTTILLVRRSRPSPSHRVEVFRLSKAHRTAVLAGDMSLQRARTLSHHEVPQQRFLTDGASRWDIDVRVSDQAITQKIESLGSGWADLFNSGRGVELSKHGVICVCKYCDFAIPAPIRRKLVKCRGCGRVSSSEYMMKETIVDNSNDMKDGSMPFIVGEDIGRYSLSCSRRIKLDVPGINYKDFYVYSQERLLVRKTGIGLKATVTACIAASNQVVFHYTVREEEHRHLLYYVLGVLCSRTMFAYHLKKSGEHEWRSHPYITPKSLSHLPIPAPTRSPQIARQASAIAASVARHLQSGDGSTRGDLEIEGLVAGLYHLDESDLQWVKSVICAAQRLEPMRELGAFDPCAVAPIRVA